MAQANAPMTEAMYYILLTLMNPNHGYQLMAEISARSGGRIQMGPGTLYGVLTRLLAEGLIALLGDDGRRKTYAVTESGKAALQAEYERLKRLVSDGAILEGEQNGK